MIVDINIQSGKLLTLCLCVHILIKMFQLFLGLNYRKKVSTCQSERTAEVIYFIISTIYKDMEIS
jgi:hypothetical protein